MKTRLLVWLVVSAVALSGCTMLKKIVGIGEVPAQFVGKQPPDSSLASSDHAHQDQNQEVSSSASERLL